MWDYTDYFLGFHPNHSLEWCFLVSLMINNKQAWVLSLPGGYPERILRDENKV